MAKKIMRDDLDNAFEEVARDYKTFEWTAVGPLVKIKRNKQAENQVALDEAEEEAAKAMKAPNKSKKTRK